MFTTLFDSEKLNQEVVRDILGPFWTMIFKEPQLIDAICKAHAITADEVEQSYKNLINLFNEKSCPASVTKTTKVLRIADSAIHRVAITAGEKAALGYQIFTVGQASYNERYSVDIEVDGDIPKILNDIEGTVALLAGIDYTRTETGIILNQTLDEHGFTKIIDVIDGIPVYAYLLFLPDVNTSTVGYDSTFSLFGNTEQGDAAYNALTKDGTVKTSIAIIEEAAGILKKGDLQIVDDIWKEGGYNVVYGGDALTVVPEDIPLSAEMAATPSLSITTDIEYADDLCESSVKYLYINKSELSGLNIGGLLVPNIDKTLLSDTPIYVLTEDGTFIVASDTANYIVADGDSVLNVDLHIGGFEADKASFYSNLILQLKANNIDLYAIVDALGETAKPTEVLYSALAFKAPSVINIGPTVTNRLKGNAKSLKIIQDTLPAGAWLKLCQESSSEDTIQPAIEDSCIAFIVYSENETINNPTSDKAIGIGAVI